MKRLVIPKVTLKTHQGWFNELLLAMLVSVIALPFCLFLHAAVDFSLVMTLCTALFGWAFVRTSTLFYPD